MLCWCAFVTARIVYFGSHDFAKKSDVIIVLGAALRNGKPTPAFLGRIRHGVELWKRGLAPKIIFTGGLAHDGQEAESVVGRRIAEGDGVPSDAILMETASTNTWENFIQSRRVMREHGMREAIIVSDPCHLHRAQTMAHDLRIAAVTSPTPYTPFNTWETRLPFMLKELRLVHSHWLSRAIGTR